MLKNTLLLLTLCILFLACEQKHFSHIYDKREIGATINSLSLTNNKNNIEKIFRKELKKEGFNLTQNSLYSLETEYRLYPKRCNNPLATAEQKSYIGFIKLTLYKNKDKIYTIQSDFKDQKETNSIINNLIDIMIEEMSIKVEK